MQERQRVFYVGELVLCWQIATIAVAAVRIHIMDRSDLVYESMRTDASSVSAILMAIGAIWMLVSFFFESDEEFDYLQSLCVILHIISTFGVVMLVVLQDESLGYCRDCDGVKSVSVWPLSDSISMGGAISHWGGSLMYWNSLHIGTLVYLCLVVVIRRDSIRLAAIRRLKWII